MDQEALKILYQGVQPWNQWIEEQKKTDWTFKARLSGLILCPDNAKKIPALWNQERRLVVNSDHCITPGADLKEIILYDAELFGVRLTYADLHHAEMNGAKLNGSNLQSALVDDAKLSETIWMNCHLEKACFNNSIMRHADFRDAILEGAFFVDTNLENSRFNSTEIKTVNFTLADLTDANFTGAVFGRVIMKDVKVNKADFSNASFEEGRLHITELNNKTSFRDTLFRNCLVSISETVDEKTAIGVLSQGVVNSAIFADPVFGRKVRDQAWLNRWLANIELMRKPAWKYWLMKSWAWYWRFSSDYGRSIGRWAALSFVIVLLFGFLFCIPDGLKFGNGRRWFTPFYFSIVTFTTLGFGDVTPKMTWSEMAVAIEVMLGYLNLGGLISIFATKVARRND